MVLIIYLPTSLMADLCQDIKGGKRNLLRREDFFYLLLKGRIPLSKYFYLIKAPAK